VRGLFDSESDSLELTQRHFYDSLRFPLAAVLFIWLIHAYLFLAGADPGWYGIMPRRLWGIRGIVTSPLVHGSWEHLLSNTFPLFVLSAITLYFYRKVAMRAFWMIYFLTGATVWLLARPVVAHRRQRRGVRPGSIYFLERHLPAQPAFHHSGADRDGVLQQHVFRYSARSGRHFLGKPPAGQPGGHFTSFWFKGELEDDELDKHDPFADERNQEKEFFLPRDIFDKTKTQRALEAEEEARRRQQQNDTFFPPFWSQDRSW
jgi:hypothetical protein